MPVILRSDDDIQILAFSDPLQVEDFSTLRIKVDQKIVQDRKYFLFDISSLKIKNNPHLVPILVMIDFCIARGTTPMIIFPDQKAWKSFTTTSKHSPSCFANLEQCLNFIKETRPQKNLNLAQPLSPQRIELEKLISTLKSRVQSKSYDTLGLSSAAIKYKMNPAKSELKILESAVLQYKKLVAENEETNSELAKLAEQMMTLIRLRKGALSPREIQKRKSELLILIRLAEIEQDVLRIYNG